MDAAGGKMFLKLLRGKSEFLFFFSFDKNGMLK
jgi:hypothetical protein